MIASASCRVSAMSAKHVIIYKYISCLFDIQMCSCTNFNFFYGLCYGLSLFDIKRLISRFLFINCTALSAEPPLLSRHRPFFKASRVSASAHEKYIFVTYNKTTHFLPL